MTEHSERRESVRVPMTFQVATTDGPGVLRRVICRLMVFGFRTFPSFYAVDYRITCLPDELQPRRVQAVIKRYFIAENAVHAAAIFEGLDFDTEVAIARCIDAYSAED